MKPEKIYIVHYTKLKDRYDHIMPFLEKCNIPYEFIRDYDQEELIDENIKDFYLADNELFTHKIQYSYSFLNSKFRILNKPEISCTIKHLIAIKKLSEECKNFGLILEDDVVFYENFNKNYKKCIDLTPSDWDAIFLGDGCGEHFQALKLSQSKKINDSCYLINHPATNCAEAYMLKSNVAKNIYKSAIPFQLVSDWEIAYNLHKIDAKIYWWYPSLVTQGSRNGKYKSTLDLGQRV